jgi:dienelactone hydrolase
MRAVRTTPGPSGQKNSSLPPKVGVAGFCWGGLYTVLWTHDTPQNKVVIPSNTAARHRRRGGGGDGKEYPLVDCAFTAHPSMLKIPEHIEMVVQPLGVANGDNDQWMGEAKMKQLVAILQSKNEAAGREVYEAVVYEGAKHGFATRADRDDPKQLETGDKCEDQVVRWFKWHFES